MSPIDEQLDAVIAMIRAAGGQVGIDPAAPEYVKKAFIEMLLECKECREAIRGKHDGSAN